MKIVNRPNPAARRRLRAVLLERDGAACCYCRLPLGNDSSIEHLEDRSKGGRNSERNCMLAHLKCNRAAVGLSVDEKMLRIGDAILARPWAIVAAELETTLRRPVKLPELERLTL